MISEAVLSAAQSENALKTYAAHKARSDPAVKLPPEASGLSGRGFLFITTGMYWRDVSKVWVDFDKSHLGFDYYHYDRAPSQGHLTLDEKTRRQMITLCNQIWESAKDNQENPGEPLRIVGIEKMTQLVLVDGSDHRVIGFSIKPLAATQQLFDQVWRLIGPRTQ